MNYFKNYTVTFFYSGYNYFTGSKKEFNEVITSRLNNYKELEKFLNTENF